MERMGKSFVPNSQRGRHGYDIGFGKMPEQSWQPCGFYVGTNGRAIFRSRGMFGCGMAQRKVLYLALAIDNGSCKAEGWKG
jgi:hypothetical protein